MDEVRIHIDSVVVDGGTALDEVAAAIRAQAGEALDAEVLVQVSRAVIDSTREA